MVITCLRYWRIVRNQSEKSDASQCLQCSVNINMSNAIHAVQALMFAMHRSAQDMHASTTPILHLMSAGASVTVRNKSGLSALMIACTSTSAGLWKLLVHITKKDIVVQVCARTCMRIVSLDDHSIQWEVVAGFMHVNVSVHEL